MEEQYLHNLESIPLSQIIKKEYRDYQIYTLMDRAIPYLQDGLKPSQRRILYTLWKHQSKGLMKVSSATGLVLTLHPHGPASVESAIVNMAQDYTFSNNYPLIDKKGYFGERMEPTPAASRYIECKLGEISKLLLFDDLDQVEMIPNYDEKVMEPLALLPKLPLMLLNGAEGIGTGFSSVIPSFHHSDIVESIIQYLESGKAKKIKPYVANYKQKIQIESNGKLVFPIKIEEKRGKIVITEIPKNYDSSRVYKFLAKHIEDDFLKDFIDSSVDNEIHIELIFKRGTQPELDTVINKLKCATSTTPNYTLISERGVKIFERPEEIIEIFAEERLKVVKKRYELRCENLDNKIRQNNEIIKFIKNKEYDAATNKANRRAFVDYLASKKYKFNEYLADMPIYRMTKEEVAKRALMVKEDTALLKEYTKVAKSSKLIQKKLIEELKEVDKKLQEWKVRKEKEKKQLYDQLSKKKKKIQ